MINFLSYWNQSRTTFLLLNLLWRLFRRLILYCQTQKSVKVFIGIGFQSSNLLNYRKSMLFIPGKIICWLKLLLNMIRMHLKTSKQMPVFLTFKLKKGIITPHSKQVEFGSISIMRQADLLTVSSHQRLVMKDVPI